MALKQVKNKIISTKKTGQVTKAMESVSAVKMRKSQEHALASRPYAYTAMQILKQLSNSQEGISHKLAVRRTEGKELIVIVTSDKGLAGSVNSAVLKQVDRYLASNAKPDVICVGRKALEYAKRQKLEILHEYTNVTDHVVITDVAQITNIAVDKFAAEEYRQVSVMYQNFLSTFEQEATQRVVLPLSTSEIHSMMQGIHAKTGKYSTPLELVPTKAVYTIEPNAEEVLSTLIPQLVRVMFYHSLLESKASEHSARMVAMKNATDKSKEMVRALTVKYNKARQAAITAEVSEITAGVEAMK